MYKTFGEARWRLYRFWALSSFMTNGGRYWLSPRMALFQPMGDTEALLRAAVQHPCPLLKSYQTT